MPLTSGGSASIDGEAILKFSGEYRWLSNFWPCEVEMFGTWYPSAEHAYQASKCLNIVDRMRFTQKSMKPGEAKRLGQLVERRPDFEERKLWLMKRVLEQKFDPNVNPELTRKLLATENRPLIEGNHWGDVFWGVCKGRGENRLGQLLMEVRQFYRQWPNRAG
jgi:ribA/ribD-fused uncharacterized protein